MKRFSGMTWAPLLAAALVAAPLATSGRLLLTVAVPVAALSVAALRLPRGPAGAVLLFLATVTLAAGLIAREPLLLVSSVLFGAAGARSAWGVNRARGRRRAWANRVLSVVGAILVAYFVIYPTLLAVDYLAKPRDTVDEAALRVKHRDITFAASDGVRLSGWLVPSRNGASIVLVHGGGGDREGAIRHARMLARAGYGVLLYDARGRGRSGGRENAFGWTWDRDVRGAVSFLRAQGVRRIGLLGISTGAEAVVTEAAGDMRVGAVVADGLQGRSAADASVLGFGNRISIEPLFEVLGWEIRIARGERPPKPMISRVHAVARTRPLLLVGTVSFEREADRAYVRGTNARLWELPRSGHTMGLRDHPRAYAGRVLAVFREGLR